MQNILISWIGKHDLMAVDGGNPGPVYAAVDAAQRSGHPFSALYFLYNYSDEEVKPYMNWLASKLASRVSVSYMAVALSSPTSYREIFPVASDLLVELDELYPAAQRTIHLSPGTPAMTAVWILLVKTRFPSACIESWQDRDGTQHVSEVELPFDIDARFIVEAGKRSDLRLSHLHSEPGDLDAFDKITGKSGIGEALEKARKMARRDVSLLLLGETGTGKEVFANAIHAASLRKDGPFIAVNCGALPANLAESLLFGHKKGAFTGANQSHDGFFSQADSGTLFLDEVGELPLDIQVKLLRALQEKSFVPVGDTRSVSSDFRIIAATHRDLMQSVADNTFREDLFYRLAVGVIKLPPLRDRGDDVSLLADTLLGQVNHELADQPGYVSKKLSDSARKLIEETSWRGNIRELRATLLRASVWSDDAELSSDNIREALIILPFQSREFLASEISTSIDVNELMNDVARHYIPLALTKTGGNKSKAAALLGLKSHQVLTDWMTKYGFEK